MSKTKHFQIPMTLKEANQEATQEAIQSKQSTIDSSAQESNQYVLCDCVCFRYIGTQDFTLKDTKGITYTLKPQDKLIVPKGVLSANLKYKATLFVEL